jgi:hypothetical protein
MYRPYTMEMQPMWNVKSKPIPVIRGANGTISKTCRKHVNSTPGKQWHRGTAENGHTGHCANTAGGANVKVQSF